MKKNGSLISRALGKIYKRMLFNKNWYVKTYKEVKEYNGTPYEHYINVGWKKMYDPSLKFSTYLYLEYNRDIKQGGICPLEHYRSFGFQEGRVVFDSLILLEKKLAKLKLYNKNYYLSHAKNITIKDNLLLDYITKGWKKGYDPSFCFSTDRYLDTYTDIINFCPLIHYYYYGRHEGRKTFLEKDIYDGNYKKRRFMFIPRYIGRICNLPTILKNRNRKMLVIYHMYYVSSFKEIKSYIKNLSCYNYDLYITYNKNNYDQKILDDIKKFKENAHLIPVSNNGFDLAPYIRCINEVNLDNYDIIFKIQSKGTYNRAERLNGQYFKNRDWFLYLYNAILGPFNVHKTVRKLTSDSNIGIVGAKNLIISDQIHKKNYTALQLNKIGIEVPEEYQFVAGTCFAERAKLAKNLKKMHISQKAFTSSERGFLTLAHAFERYLNIDVLKQGYTLSGNRVNTLRRLRWKAVEKTLKDIDGMRILKDNNNVCLSDEFLTRTLEHAFIDFYEFKKVRLGDINIEFADEIGHYYKIDELVPYQYLENPKKNKKKYIDYCKEKRRTDYLDISKKEFEETIEKICCQRFDNLISNLEKENYDNDCAIILNSKNHVILDGLHRASWLMHKYGKDKKIKMLVLTFGYYKLNAARPFSKKLKRVKY